jgi:hypothetical protein
MVFACEEYLIVLENRWKDITVEFELKCSSDTVLIAQPENAPAGFTILSLIDGKILVEPMQTKKVLAIFCPSKVKNTPGPIQCEIKFVNANNPLNRMLLTITAEITACALRFSRLDEGDLILPPLAHPSDIPADNWLVMENTGDTPLGRSYKFSC